jgi:hypothetical protein
MSVQNRNSVPPDWLPDWLRSGTPVPAAPRQDEAGEALGPRGEEALPDPSVAQHPAGRTGQVVAGFGECEHVDSTEGAPPGPGGVAVRPPPAAHGGVQSDGGDGSIAMEGFPLDDLTGEGGVGVQPANGRIVVKVDPERDRSVKCDMSVIVYDCADEWLDAVFGEYKFL